MKLLSRDEREFNQSNEKLLVFVKFFTALYFIALPDVARHCADSDADLMKHGFCETHNRDVSIISLNITIKYLILYG